LISGILLKTFYMVIFMPFMVILCSFIIRKKKTFEVTCASFNEIAWMAALENLIQLYQAVLIMILVMVQGRPMAGVRGMDVDMNGGRSVARVVKGDHLADG